MKEIIYELLVKGWGEYEDWWYPHNQGPEIYKLKQAVFKDWDTEAKFKVMILGTETVVEEGVINKGVF